MNLLKSLLVAGASVGLVGMAHAADLPTKKTPDTTASCFSSFWDYVSASAADCPLSYMGVTVYGQIDVGVGYSSHGANFSPVYNNGVAELIAKYSQGYKYQWVPNGLSQSNAGIKIREEFSPGWAFVGDWNFGFNPYSFELANGPMSLVQNNNKTIGNQGTNSDSSRAGQWDNTRAYIGLNNSTYGTLTVGRQYSFSADAVNNYDPMAGSYAFSLIGSSSTYASGVGDTEVARYNTSLKYFVQYNSVRAGAVWQWGGYAQGNGSDGAYQFDLGADYKGFSFDAIYSHGTNAVSLSTYAVSPLPAGVGLDDLKATLSNIDGGIFAGKYTWGPFTGYGGYEYARFSPPSNDYPGGFSTLGGYNVLPGAANSTSYVTNKVLQVAWLGGKYSILSNLDLTGAGYYAWQNDYAPPGSKASVCGPNTKAPIPGGTPRGTLNSYCAGDIYAFSSLIDWRPLKRLDIYAGFMYSEVSGGIASGYINTNNFAPTVGVRISF